MTDEQKQNAQPFPECLPQRNFQKNNNPIIIHINNNGNLLISPEIVELKDLKNHLLKLNGHLSFEQRQKKLGSEIHVEEKTPKDAIQEVEKILTEFGSATIDIVGPKDNQFLRVQQSATREEMKEYNTLAKKYNEMDRNHMSIKKSEVSRLKVLFGKMSEKQREDAEPFPDFPPAPPTPDAPKPPKNVSDTEYASNEIGTIIEEQDPYDVVGRAVRTKQPKQPEPPLSPRYIKDIEPTSPPPPPPPKSPLEYVKEMAKKGATFIYKGKKISSDKAIEILKSNKELSISTEQKNSDTPVVKISKYL